jgi:redox-sensing transcriptional repressor
MEQVEEQKKIIGVPEPTLRRMPMYLSYIKAIEATGIRHISAPHIAFDLNFDPTQVTKDLAYTGIKGKTKIGYQINDLIKAIENFMGFNRSNEIFLVGAGNLGAALVKYEGFKQYGIKVIAAFDINPDIIGCDLNGVPVFHIDKFRDLAKRLHVVFGIITVPASAAQQVADMMVSWGIKAIWNFAPISIKVPDDIILQHTSIYANLALILNKLQTKYH